MHESGLAPTRAVGTGADHAPAIGAVIMAAGAGRRMGNVPKPLLRRDGESLLVRQIRLSAEAGADVMVVVLGFHAERLAAVLERTRSSSRPPSGTARLDWVVNPAPDAGAGSSLRCGLAALPAHLSTWLVMLGDQPLLELADVREILRAWAARPVGIELMLPQYAGQPGHPVVFGQVVREALMRARDGQGALEWRRAHPERIVTVPVSHARCTTDVDTPADLVRLYAERGVRLE